MRCIIHTVTVGFHPSGRISTCTKTEEQEQVFEEIRERCHQISSRSCCCSESCHSDTEPGCFNCACGIFNHLYNHIVTLRWQGWDFFWGFYKVLFRHWQRLKLNSCNYVCFVLVSLRLLLVWMNNNIIFINCIKTSPHSGAFHLICSTLMDFIVLVEPLSLITQPHLKNSFVKHFTFTFSQMTSRALRWTVGQHLLAKWWRLCKNTNK